MRLSPALRNATSLLVVRLLSATLVAQTVDWDAAVQAAAHDTGFHGVVLVQKGDDIILNKAFSTPEFPVVVQTRYWIASISKSFTATLIFRLRDDGLLSLDDPLSKFFPKAPPDKRGITVTQLLTHQSGLPNKYVSEGIADRAEAARRILALPLVHKPGEAFEYTNDGYSLLGLVASIAAHTDYSSLIDEKIFRPAAMMHSGFWPNCRGSKDILPLSVSLPARMLRPNWGYKGPDGICSTAPDLALFMDAMLKRKILAEATVQEMWAPRRPVSAGSATAGWFWVVTPQGTDAVMTRGTDHGHNSIITYYIKRSLIVVALSSSKDPDGPLLARLLVDKLEKTLGL